MDGTIEKMELRRRGGQVRKGFKAPLHIVAIP